MSIDWKIAFWWISQNLTDEKSTSWNDTNQLTEPMLTKNNVGIRRH